MKVFVAWDSVLVTSGLTFANIVADSVADVAVVILGAAGKVAFGELHQILVGSMGACSAWS